MNNNRLSSKDNGVTVDRRFLESEVDRLLRSNFEVRENGRVFNKSLNKYYFNRIKIGVEIKDSESNTIIKSFDSKGECVDI